MPGTAELRGLEDPFNPAEALTASARYLADLARDFGNIGLAAVAYNGGEARAAVFVAAKGAPPRRNPRLRPGHHRPLRRRLARRAARQARPRAPRRSRLPGRLHRSGRDPQAPRIPRRPAGPPLGRHSRLEPRPRRRRAPGRPAAEPLRRPPRRRAGQLHPWPPPGHGRPPLHGPGRPREPHRGRRPLRPPPPRGRRLHGAPELRAQASASSDCRSSRSVTICRLAVGIARPFRLAGGPSRARRRCRRDRAGRAPRETPWSEAPSSGTPGRDQPAQRVGEVAAGGVEDGGVVEPGVARRRRRAARGSPRC